MPRSRSNLQLAIRGNPENLGAEVPRHFLSILRRAIPTPFTKGSGRLELAEDILKQPIAMRVIVNRIWKGHFGTGIVDTPSNFGITGERPTNPELLEYLASTFVKNGMSIKKLHREIMLSSVYQLRARERPARLCAKDSGNRFYWRVDRKRMDAEQLRDSVLLVSGNLDDVAGRSVGRSHAGLHAPHRLRQSQPLQAGRVSAALRFPGAEHQRGKALHHHRSAAAPVPDEQRFHAGRSRKSSPSASPAEPDNRARIKKLYRWSMAASRASRRSSSAIDYLHAEPMQEFEEARTSPSRYRRPVKPRKTGGAEP